MNDVRKVEIDRIEEKIRNARHSWAHAGGVEDTPYIEQLVAERERMMQSLPADGELVNMNASEVVKAKKIPDAWSFLRNVLTQGMAIQSDYHGGKYANYELLSARLDEAAREREEELRELIVKPSHSPAAVAWRFVYSDDSGQWYPGAPTEGIMEGARQAGSGIQLAYSQPAAQVPHEVVRLLINRCNNHPDDAKTPIIRDWLKSIGGAK